MPAAAMPPAPPRKLSWWAGMGPPGPRGEAPSRCQYDVKERSAERSFTETVRSSSYGKTGLSHHGMLH